MSTYQLKKPLLSDAKRKNQDQSTKQDVPEEPIAHVKKSITPITPNPFAKTSFWGLRFCTWTNVYFDKAENEVIKNSDLLSYGQPAKAEQLEKEFLEQQNKKGNENLSEIQLCYRVINPSYTKGMLFYILSSCFEFCIPLLVSRYLALMGRWEDGPELPFIHDRVKLYSKYIWPSIFIVSITLLLFIRFCLNNEGLFWMKFSRARLATILRIRIMEKLKSIQLSRIDNYSESSVINMLISDIDSIASGLLIKPDLITSFIMLPTGFLIFYFGVERNSSSEKNIELIILGIFVVGMVLNQLFRVKATVLRTKMLLVNDYKCKLIRGVFRQIWHIKSSESEPVIYQQILEHYLIQNELKLSYLRWDNAAQLAATLLPTIFAAVIFGANFLDKSNQDNSEKTAYLILTMLSIVKKPINSISKAFRTRPIQKASWDRIVEFLEQDDRREIEQAHDTGLGRM